MKSKRVASMACLVGLQLSITGCGAEPQASVADGGQSDRPDGDIETPDGGTAHEGGGLDIDFERPSHYEPTSSIEEACAQRADAMCAATAACSILGFVFLYGDMEHCRTSLREHCLVSAGAPGSHWEAADLNACANEYATLSCDEFSSRWPWEHCASLEPGSGAAGASCVADSQCQSSQCSMTFGESCGQCKGVIGDSCDHTGDCRLGLQCVYGEDGGRCRLDPTVGEACPHGGCWNSTCQFGRCEAYREVGLGESCSDSADVCEQHLTCDRDTKTCEHPLIGKAGDSCEPGSKVICPGTAPCAFETKRCVPRARPGEPCEGTYCFRGFECIDGICRWPEPASCG